jgi:hypothetical protein
MKAVSIILDSLEQNKDLNSASAFSSLYSVVKYLNSTNASATLLLCAKNSKAALKQIVKSLDDYTSREIDSNYSNPYDLYITFLFMIASEADPSISDALGKKISNAKNLFWANKIVTSGLLKQELSK